MNGARRTISREITLEGVGLHLGVSCRLTFEPAVAGQGVRFVRIDRPGAPAIAAVVEHAVLTERRTQLGTGDDAIHTVEHVLAAVAGAEIDDVTIELDGPEPPIMDGSAAPFLEALSVGRPDRAAWAGAVSYAPGAGARGRRRVGLRGASIGHAGSVRLDRVPASVDRAPSVSVLRHARRVCTEIAPARTFGFVREVDALRSRGLIRGGSTENAVVLDERCRREHVALARRIRAAQGARLRRGSGARWAASPRQIVAHKPSHRGTILAGSRTHQAGREGEHRVRHRRHHEGPAAPVSVLARRPDSRDRGGKRIVGLKNVTINEPFFQGHFPGHPIMPGVLIIEAMAQVGGMLLMGSVDDPETKVVYFMSLDNVKWRRPVKPGDQIRFELRGRADSRRASAA